MGAMTPAGRLLLAGHVHPAEHLPPAHQRVPAIREEALLRALDGAEHLLLDVHPHAEREGGVEAVGQAADEGGEGHHGVVQPEGAHHHGGVRRVQAPAHLPWWKKSKRYK
eukprot:773023-Prorocentrum_minimum.AAC.4